MKKLVALILAVCLLVSISSVAMAGVDATIKCPFCGGKAQEVISSNPTMYYCYSCDRYFGWNSTVQEVNDVGCSDVECGDIHCFSIADEDISLLRAGTCPYDGSKMYAKEQKDGRTLYQCLKCDFYYF